MYILNVRRMNDVIAAVIAAGNCRDRQYASINQAIAQIADQTAHQNFRTLNKYDFLGMDKIKYSLCTIFQDLLSLITVIDKSKAFDVIKLTL